MFIGYYEADGTTFYYLYCNTGNGWDEFHKDTFYPETKNIKVLVFEVKGKNHKERKEYLRDLAIDWQLNFSTLDWSYSELAEILDFFETAGRRYGLLKEFRENGII